MLSICKGCSSFTKKKRKKKHTMLLVTARSLPGICWPVQLSLAGKKWRVCLSRGHLGMERQLQ